MVITHELSLHTRGHADVVGITGQAALTSRRRRGRFAPAEKGPKDSYD